MKDYRSELAKAIKKPVGLKSGLAEIDSCQLHYRDSVPGNPEKSGGTTGSVAVLSPAVFMAF